MYRTRIMFGICSISLAIFGGCLEEPTGEALALEESETALHEETDEADVDGAEETQGADEGVPDEPEGTPPVEGQPAPAPFEGIEGNYTGGDVSTPDAGPLDAEAMSKVAAADASSAFSPDECWRPNRPVRILPLKHYAQEKGFYCGPATGYMMIRYLHGPNFKSRKDGSPLKQSKLANQAHMQTEARHSTPWDAKVFTKGVNAWRGNSYYVQLPHPSASRFDRALGYSILEKGMPLAADTVEIGGGAHYNGHPVNRTIGHWIAVYGYDGCAAKAYFADPATSVWSAVKPKFSYAIKQFANRFLQSNGIVY
jgi:hypothetical protein